MKFLLLALAGVGYGLLGAVLFRRVRVRAEVNRVIAHVLSFRLFIDEPGLVFRAQVELARENLRLLRKIALPCVAMALTFALSYGLLDRYFGRGSVPVGQPIVITASGALAMPPGVIAETTAVRVPRLHQVAWRVHVEPGFAGVFPKGVQVPYPRARILGLEWWVWFLLFSAVGALFSTGLETSLR